MTMTVRERSWLHRQDVWHEPTELCHPHAEATIWMVARCTGQKTGNKESQSSSTNLVTATSTLNLYLSVTAGLGGVA
jgi:hypothetical protein